MRSCFSFAFWMKAPSCKDKQPTNADPPMLNDEGGDTMKLTGGLHDANESSPSVVNFSGIILAGALRTRHSAGPMRGSETWAPRECALVYLIRALDEIAIPQGQAANECRPTDAE